MAERGFEKVLAPSHYFDLQAAIILPGEYNTMGRDMLLITMLDSFQAACIRDRVSRVLYQQGVK